MKLGERQTAEQLGHDPSSATYDISYMKMELEFSINMNTKIFVNLSNANPLTPNEVGRVTRIAYTSKPHDSALLWIDREVPRRADAINTAQLTLEDDCWVLLTRTKRCTYLNHLRRLSIRKRSLT